MSTQAATAILTEGLTKIYSGRQIALNGVNLEIAPGTVLGVLGQNGAGKTTLVKLLLGLQIPTAGRVFMLGKRMTPNAASLRQRIGYLPADPRFPDGMTAIQYLDFAGRLGGLRRAVRRPRLAMLLRAVELLKASGEKIREFSTGMKIRLAIAASLINDPEILIWDEPSQGLDPEARRGLLQLVQSLAEHKTLVLSSHNLTDVQEVCSQAIVLHEGQVIYNGSLEDLRGKLKPDVVEILIMGDKKEIAEAVKSIQGFEELENCTHNKNLLRLKIKEGTSHATAIANVLVTLADHNIEATDVRFIGQQAEQALVNLKREEGNRGFTRAYQPSAA
ncbi:MAG: ABC transporter ATP-binding protein [Planctomycetota bacterium]